jgi:hypothetical protein
MIEDAAQTAANVVVNVATDTMTVVGDVVEGTGDALTNVAKGTGEVLSNVASGTADLLVNTEEAVEDAFDNAHLPDFSGDGGDGGDGGDADDADDTDDADDADYADNTDDAADEAPPNPADLSDVPINLEDHFYVLTDDSLYIRDDISRELYGTRKPAEPPHAFDNCQLRCESLNQDECAKDMTCYLNSDDNDRCYSKVGELPCPGSECEMIILLRGEDAQFDATQSAPCDVDKKE